MSHHTGELLGGRYRLDDRIAVGGMGEVWRGTDTVLRRTIAVKTLRGDRATDPQFRGRFQQEARAMAALHHPGIADVYDFGQEPGDDAYLVMARVSGRPLNQLIAEAGRLPVAGTMPIVAQVAGALQAAHEAGIVHRDVKPGNIIVQPDGRAVLVDFGVCRSDRSAALTGAQEVVGTAHYIAPEQVAKRPVAPATDVYSLGAVAYECLAGHPPFVGDNPITIAMQHLREEPPPLPEDVPPQARALVATALAKDPAARFPSAAAMARAAEMAVQPDGGTAVETAVLGPLRAGSGPPAPRAPAGRTHRRRVVAALVLAMLVLLGAATAVAFAYPFGRAPAPPASTTAPTTPASPARSAASSSSTGKGAGAETRHPSPSASRTTSRSPSPAASTSHATSPSATTTNPQHTPATTQPPSTGQQTTEPPVVGRALGGPAGGGDRGSRE